MGGFKYEKIHYWLRLHFGNPVKCNNCGKDGSYSEHRWKDKIVKRWNIQWSLINGKSHERNKDNYKGLCIGCHKKHDSVNVPFYTKRL